MTNSKIKKILLKIEEIKNKVNTNDQFTNEKKKGIKYKNIKSTGKNTQIS